VPAPSAPSEPDDVSATTAGSPDTRALVAEADTESAKEILELLSRWEIAADAVHDGSEALLSVHRKQPGLVILGGHLPNVSAPLLAEVLRRNPELKSIRLIRVLTLDEPSAAPEFDADHFLEPGDLPNGLEPLLEELGIGRRPPAPAPELSDTQTSSTPTVPERECDISAPAPTAEAHAPSAVEPVPSAVEPVPSAVERRKGPEDRRKSPDPAPVSSKKKRRSRPVSSDPQIAAAERLARIIVSDIILYNEAKFASGVDDGDVAAAVKEELTEGGTLFCQRISEEVRKKRDFLGEELEFRADQFRGRQDA
jgi:CheY-like chemotaxis protein